MTNQEFFQIVWERAKDPRLSLSITGTGAYRGEDALACFVGAAVPDEEYTPSCEDTPVYALRKHGLFPTLEGVHLRLLEQCQDVHDDDEPRHWKSALEEIADEWGLRLPQS